MANCPFCLGEIEEDLLIYGGSCPRCFGEIPGEETPTNPGEEVQAQQEALDKKHLVAGKRRVAVLTGLLVASVIGLAFGTVFWPEEEVMQLVDFDQYEGWDDLNMDFEEAVAVNEVVADAPKSSTKRVRRKARVNNNSDSLAALQRLKNTKVAGLGGASGFSDEALQKMAQSTGSGSGVQLKSRTADANIGEMAQIEERGGGLASLASLDLAPKTRISRGIPNFTLTDDNKIIEMVGRVLRKEVRGLRSCYTQRLKATPDLRGRWVLNLTVGKDGKPKKIRVEPTGVSDDVLESCINKRVNRWEFQKIKADLPVKKSLRFAPG